MSTVRLGPIPLVRGRLRVPGDKSIGHRALLLNAVAEGAATVRGLPAGDDVHTTRSALVALGIRIESAGEDRVRVTGGGREAWLAAGPVDCGNSGTTARLLMGILAPRASEPVTLTGDRSLSRRPMARVVEPLRRMGAAIEAAGREPDRLPLAITGRPLEGAIHRLPVASAQVKSALLLAGLAAEGETRVAEPMVSRDHSERLLAAMGARIDRASGGVRLRPGRISAIDVDVPGDLSSAAPFLALAAAREGSEIVIEDVGLNPTRTGFLDLLRAFGAEVEAWVEANDPEPRGTLRVAGRGLKAIEVGPAAVPGAIDELPLVAVLATRAEGETRISGAAELRVKESDRIAAIAAGLGRLGAEIETAPDGFTIHGPTRLDGAELEAAGDHRIGMALAVAAALAESPSALEGAQWVAVSYPSFFEDLASLAEARTPA
ncbi:MAG TPA: 3-phosphoshikimate 1-carboxyvinyltransferase [Gemmatimonadota bacterium]|nr:3-phosphoshikimate 1-carboxyvinyltransferase [Gemmatimonadota bacterium]